ncbi:hypothetical protein PanWU01x14_233450, partial [Parasponia andersonii]
MTFSSKLSSTERTPLLPLPSPVFSAPLIKNFFLGTTISPSFPFPPASITTFLPLNSRVPSSLFDSATAGPTSMPSPKPTIGGGLTHTSTVSFTLLPLFFPTKAEDTFCESSSTALRALDLVTLTGFSSILFFFIMTFLLVSVFFLKFFFFFDLKSSYMSDSDSTSVPTNINVSFSGLNLTFFTFLATTTESISLSASPKPLIPVFSSS